MEKYPSWPKGLPWKGSRSLTAARGFKSLFLRSTNFLKNLFKEFSGFVVYCSVINVLFVVAVSCDSFYIISKCFMFVNNFFNYFLLLFLNLSSSNSDILSYIFLLVNNFFEVFFKRYFQTKRRKRDSNPRAGCPTYTLSRGASSAS